MSYPDIIVSANTESEAKKLQKALRKRGIFTRYVSLDEVTELKAPIDLLIVMSKKYSSRAYAALLYAKRKLHNIKTMIVGDALQYADADIDAVVTYSNVDNGDCISEVVSRLLGRCFTFAECLYTASDLSDAPFVYFRGTRIFLSEREAYIVHLLAVFGEDRADHTTLSALVGLTGRSISTYIYSINKKSRELTGYNMIFTNGVAHYSLFKPEHKNT